MPHRIEKQVGAGAPKKWVICNCMNAAGILYLERYSQKSYLDLILIELADRIISEMEAICEHP